MRQLAEIYGAETTYRVGLEVLGFPPNWAQPAMKQVLTLQQALEQRKQNHAVGIS